MARLLLCVIILIALCACSDDGRGGGAVTSALETSIPSVATIKIASGLNAPVQITNAGDGSRRLFILEKRGIVKVIKDKIVQTTPFIDISNKVNSSGSEQGLLGIAFPSGFPIKRHFYVNYTSHNNVGDTVIERVQLNDNGESGNPQSAQAILSITQPFSNHNGGQMLFGPDGFLYIGVGDGGGAGDPLNRAQSLSSLLGKILRIDVESGGTGYRIPTGNVFGNEIWALGLRNPWRFTFDRETGDLFIADVGQNQFEEINFQDNNASGGQNYGWKIMEGMHCFQASTCNRNSLLEPIHEYAHTEGNCSITGGHVYRGTQYPSLQGIYIYGDLCSGKIWGLRQTLQGWENKLIADTAFQISSFGEDEEGNIYLLDFSSGELHQIVLP